MASWGLFDGSFDAATQINRRIENEAYALAAAGPIASTDSAALGQQESP